MDLFVVNRYKGDEKPDASDEKAKLDKVLKKIKKRRLAREKKRHEENLKVNKASKLKIKKDKAKKLEKKLKQGLLLSKEEAKDALALKVINVKDLAAKSVKGQVLPSKTTAIKVKKLINKGVVALEESKEKEKKKDKKKKSTKDESAEESEDKTAKVHSTKKKRKVKKQVREKDESNDEDDAPNREESNSDETNEESSSDESNEESNSDESNEEESNQASEEEEETADEKQKVEETKAVKKKKKRVIDETETTNEAEDTKEEIPETSTKKKLKKRKKKAEDSETDEPKKKKSKKSSPDDVEGFTILGVDKFDKKKSVKRVLPKWLRNPTVISSDLNKLDQKISRANLNTELKKKLKEKQIKYLFPVQAEFIPWQLKVSNVAGLIAAPDACISAPTGSGKTLAFTIPVLQSLQQQLENHCLTIKAIRALIILPTQNLALQIYDTFKSLIPESKLNVGLATGAGNRTLEAEQKQLIAHNSIWGTSSKVEILVCTAGRLVDHLKSTKGFDLKHLQYVIIDEADRVLDSIQDDWLYHLGIHLQADARGNYINRNIVNVESVKHRNDPQKLLFSATLSQDPEKLQKLSLFQPKLFSCISENDNASPDTERFIGKYTTPAELTEKYIICTIEIKPLVLYKLIIDEIDKNQTSRILVFVNTVETLHRLHVLLKFMGQEKFTVAEFSSSQGNLKARNTLLKKFELGFVQVLVCTDSMARGIDIPNVDCVISYSVPNHLKTYIHRAGRTARAGSTGLCISMMHTKQQKTFLSMIENMRSQTKHIDEISIPNEDLEILTPLYEQCLVQLKEKVSDESEKSALRIKTKKMAFNKRKSLKHRKKSTKKAT